MLIEQSDLIMSISDKRKEDSVINNKSHQIFIKCKRASLSRGKNR